jgi:hypothetical protein
MNSLLGTKTLSIRRIIADYDIRNFFVSQCD